MYNDFSMKSQTYGGSRKIFIYRDGIMYCRGGTGTFIGILNICMSIEEG